MIRNNTMGWVGDGGHGVGYRMQGSNGTIKIICVGEALNLFW